jgi:hypothetical protein
MYKEANGSERPGVAMRKMIKSAIVNNVNDFKKIAV